MRLLFALAFWTASTVVAASQLNPFGVADAREVRFDAAVMVGSTLLPAGKYRVIHTMQGSNHLMLFRNLSGANARATALVPCKLKPLAVPISATVVGVENVGGVRVLTFLQFKGDTAVHVF